MRVFAVVLAIAVWSCRAHDRPTTNVDRLLTALHIKQRSATGKLVHCAFSLGPTKCASALGAWRAGKAVEAFSRHRNVQFNLTADVEQFPWERYENVTDEVLHSQLNERTQKLLQHRPMKLSIPGYDFYLKSNGRGKLNVEFYRKNEEDTETSRGKTTETSRATKKMRKQFYQILPFLVVPGLLVYAVLPLILPGLKMLTMASGLLNSLALAGAIFVYLKNHGGTTYYDSDKKVTVIDVSYGTNGKRVPNHYYSGSAHNYDVIEPNSMQINDDLSQEFQNDWSNQNLMPQASQQTFQYATENTLLSSYLNMKQQPKIRIAYPSLLQDKSKVPYPEPNQQQFGINYPQLQPLPPQLPQPFELNYPTIPVQQKVELSYPNEQIQHEVELSYIGSTVQPGPTLSYATESDIPDIGIDLNQNQLPHIEGLGVQNGELQQKMEMSYLKGLQNQQVRIANEQSKQNLDTSYPVEQLSDQIRRSGDEESTSNEDVSTQETNDSSSEVNIYNITSTSPSK